LRASVDTPRKCIPVAGPLVAGGIRRAGTRPRRPCRPPGRDAARREVPFPRKGEGRDVEVLPELAAWRPVRLDGGHQAIRPRAWACTPPPASAAPAAAPARNG